MAAEFATTLKSRWRGRDELFGIYAVSNPFPHGRLGIVVSRKVSARAVVRNRIKRQIRETFRQSQEILAGLDVVVVASPKASTAPMAALRASLQKLWEKVEEQCRKS
jgi:ribonuclease P protein component